MKRTFYICMVLLLCFCFMPVQALATEGDLYAPEMESDIPVTEPAGDEEIGEDRKDYVSLFEDDRNRDNERAIQSVDSGAVVNPATINNTLDAYDILTRVALVFTLISVVVLWIRHTINQRKDPIRKYLK